MKNTFHSAVLIMTLLYLLSCKTKAPVTGSPESAKGTQTHAVIDSAEITGKKPLSADRERVAAKESWRGNEIVEESVYRLSSKLSTAKDTNEQIKKILTDSFTAIGGDLSKTYPAKEAKEMGKKIIVNSKDTILSVLESDEQRTEFKNFFLH